jgi:hypothetical protein
MDVIIKPNTKIGELDAESDAKFLSNCFIDNGMIETLCDVDETQAIILGRTGAGKTATLMKINDTIEEDKSKIIDLEQVFLNYIDNSNVINFLKDNNVNLDVFYRYLWKHILTVEFLKLKYPNWNETNKLANFINELANLLKKPQEKVAYKYLVEWSDKYWIETEENVKEMLSTLTQNIETEFEGKLEVVNNKLKGSKELTKEERIEYKDRAQRAVNKIQISDLAKVVDILDEYVFNDHKVQYYLLIDKLDENWTRIDIKYDLIKSLIEEIKSFRKIRNVKILVSLRVDLYFKTLEKTRSAGFQEDKLQSIMYKLKWDERALKTIVDTRISYLYKSKYTKENVVFEDIFPPDNKKGNSWNYILQRTFWRPRDILQFINYCLEFSTNKVSIDWGAIQDAEKAYSRERLRSLYEEWYEIFPALENIVSVLSSIKKIDFTIEEFSSHLNSDLALNLLIDIRDEKLQDPIIQSLSLLMEKPSFDNTNFKNDLISCFYQTGLIGVSENLLDNFEWSFRDTPYKSEIECSKVKRIKIHKMFHEAFHLRD